MIEKTIAASLEPIVDMVIRLEKQVHAIDQTIDQVKSKDGAPGKDAEPVDTEKLKHDGIVDLAISDVIKTAIDHKTQKEIEEINQVFNGS